MFRSRALVLRPSRLCSLELVSFVAVLLCVFFFRGPLSVSLSASDVVWLCLSFLIRSAAHAFEVVAPVHHSLASLLVLGLLVICQSRLLLGPLAPACSIRTVLWRHGGSFG